MTLVEILVALGILAGVLVSVASLFVLGGQRVSSGRHMTEATAIASDILEEINQMGSQVTGIFPSCTTATGCTVATDTDSFASAQWQSLIDQTLFQGRAEITLTPIGGPTSPPDFSSAEGLRVRVEVLWMEGTNQRRLATETVMF
jgi:type II secretory pathway pseudopilin PulG